METYYFLLFGFTAFAFGACVASFLNVCIWRIPRGESVVRPGSHCPKCGAAIRWWQNVPVVSWLALRGRCANCREPISPRYITVEIIGGLLFFAAYMQWATSPFGFFPLAAREGVWLGMSPLTLPMIFVWWVVFSGLILGSYVDLDHYYLPDRVTVGGILFGLAASFAVPDLQYLYPPLCAHEGLSALAWSAIGGAVGFFGLWGLGAVFTKILKKEAMGFGDVKLLGAFGTLFGPWGVLFTLVLSAFVGSVVGIAMIARGKARIGSCTAVPYGPMLALGAVVWMLWGPRLLVAYLRLYAPSGM